MGKLGWIVLLAIWSFVPGVIGYNHLRASIFREGYERGAVHTADYVACSGWKRLPSQAWRDQAWNHVDGDFDNCDVVEELRRKVGESPFTAGPWAGGVEAP